MLLGDKVYANTNSRLAQVSKHSDFDVVETLEVRTIKLNSIHGLLILF